MDCRVSISYLVIRNADERTNLVRVMGSHIIQVLRIFAALPNFLYR
jgi:hypothetical protein